MSASKKVHMAMSTSQTIVELITRSRNVSGRVVKFMSGMTIGRGAGPRRSFNVSRGFRPAIS
jgi:hypothetical protein